MLIQRNFEDDHIMFRRWTDCNASNVVVLICVITWQHIWVPVLDQGTSLLLGPWSWVVGWTPLGTALVKQSPPLVVSCVPLGDPCPVMRINRT